MGLLDILNGMKNGPHGQPQPSTPAGRSGGMSPMTMALIGLLAYKAMKSFGGAQGAPAGTPTPAGTSTGGLGDILGGLLGGSAAGRSTPAGGLGDLLGGNSAGSVLSGGLGRLINDLQKGGLGKSAQSWVDTGPNDQVSPGGLADALGHDTIDALSRQTGMSKDDLLAGLSEQLPEFVNKLTPHGRLPTEDEARRML